MIRFVCVVLCLISCSMKSDPTLIQIENDVRSAFDSLVKDAKTLDVDKYINHFQPNTFVGINADGTVCNSLEEFKTLYATGVSMMDSYINLEFPVVKISVLNNTTAILVNEYKYTVQLKNGSEFTGSGAGTQVWVKQSGTWKLASVSSSVNKENE